MANLIKFISKISLFFEILLFLLLLSQMSLPPVKTINSGFFLIKSLILLSDELGKIIGVNFNLLAMPIHL